MAASTTLLEQRSRTLVSPGFLAIIGLVVLVRGFTSADTTGGRIVVGVLGGGLLLLGGGLVVHELRKAPWRLEVTPEHIVLWHRDGAGIRIGTTPPIRVRRRIIGGANPTTWWVLADAAEVAVRFHEGGSEALYGVDAKIDLHAFDPKAVLEAVQRAGWPAEWCP